MTDAWQPPLGEDAPDALASAESALDDAVGALGRAHALDWDSPAGDAFRDRLIDVVHRLRRDGDALHDLRHRVAATLRGPL